MTMRIEKEKLLLVEGKDEIHFFDALLTHININDIQVIEVGGKDNFKNEFPALLLSPDFSRVKSYGIVRDADDSPDNTFQSITDMLKRHQQPIPTAPGKITSSNSMTIGIYIMPGNSEEGMLEDLCLKTVSNHPVLACVDEYMICLQNNLKRENLPRTPAKAKMHAFLAGMSKFKPDLGTAAKKGYFNLDSEILNNVKLFLQELLLIRKYETYEKH